MRCHTPLAPRLHRPLSTQLPKTPFSKHFPTPSSVHVTATAPSSFQKKPNPPCLGEDPPLSDRKLTDISHEPGSVKTQEIHIDVRHESISLRAQKWHFFYPSPSQPPCPKEWYEILNPNCTVLAGLPRCKTLRFRIRSDIAVSSKELAGKCR